MTFIDTKLSRKVSVGFSGGPTWNTRVVPMASGVDKRNAEWALPHHKFTADYTLLDPESQNEILIAFWAARGQKDSFRFKDWNDFKAINQAMANGDGTSTPRQLTKTYTFGPTSFVRNILLPIASTVVVTANGTPIAVTTNETTGMVTPVSPWPSGQVIKSSCEFDVRVRFGSDFIPFTRNAPRLGTVTIELVEALTA
ncbi:DUF2460 domain-containing protein [Variovorax ginsengisoli]|uniref:DUF2460 domain-containing protein n=1 Tax=Variovorax ginsengisoli TaxID=363844 RepID=A0ABT8RZ69_9BURK|nr:DUF2460 domain-containing protein [Variovorax ginsengisoli]MDN8612802.1 DUF2460 domain-containing protein [Variovorax ginsengisoli]MDO1531972.1 DUF2460 domain-containing protein [Variovorax ginsengisoli]